MSQIMSQPGGTGEAATIGSALPGHPGGFAVKKGRHRRFEEARALKRSQEVDLDDLFEEISETSEDETHKPEHDAWADVAEEWDRKGDPDAEPSGAES